MNLSNSNPIVAIENLTITYKTKKGLFHAISDLSLSIERGETLGLVGESGCGKTTLGKTLIGLVSPKQGHVHFMGKDLYKLKRKALLQMGSQVQMIFQDPYSSLNPRMTIEEIVTEPLEIYRMGSRKERKMRLINLLELVGLDESFSFRYPHELSGGQRQRVGIARALAPKPKFLICDEPTAALDVSIQAQIINLLKQLKNELDLTYLFISHDLAVVKHLCDRIAVMHFGKLVETNTSEKLFQHQEHPYTKALLAAALSPIPERNEKQKSLQKESLSIL